MHKKRKICSALKILVGGSFLSQSVNRTKSKPIKPETKPEIQTPKTETKPEHL